MANIKKNINIEQFVKIANDSASASEAARRLGIPFTTYKRYAEKFNVFKTNMSGKGIKNINPYEILYRLENSNYQISGKRIKEVLFKLGIKEEKCEICGLKYWNGKLIPLELHHIDGNKFNNRIDNFQILCPNCHSLTDNFRGRILKDKKLFEINEDLSISKNCRRKDDRNKSKKRKSIYKLTDKKCANCDNFLNENQITFCSYKCQREFLGKNVPSSEELQMLLKQYKNFSAIGRVKGVSGVSVKKWFIKRGLYKKGMIGLGNG